ncbi:MAG: hypothetical protein WC828_04625 [Thermoleophilia bacterium]
MAAEAIFLFLEGNQSSFVEKESAAERSTSALPQLSGMDLAFGLFRIECCRNSLKYLMEQETNGHTGTG